MSEEEVGVKRRKSKQNWNACSKGEEIPRMKEMEDEEKRR